MINKLTQFWKDTCALVINNACKGIYDIITEVAKEFGVEEQNDSN